MTAEPTATSLSKIEEVSGKAILTAIRERRLFSATDLLKSAVKSPNNDIIDALRLFFCDPPPYLRVSRHKKNGWIQFRVQALQTLAEIGTPEALDIIAEVLLTTDLRDVRHNARRILKMKQGLAAPSLLNAIQVTVDWKTAGMINAIKLLSNRSNMSEENLERIAIVFARILDGNLPKVPNRWSNGHTLAAMAFHMIVGIGASIVGFVILMRAMETLLNDTEDLFAHIARTAGLLYLLYFVTSWGFKRLSVTNAAIREMQEMGEIQTLVLNGISMIGRPEVVPALLRYKQTNGYVKSDKRHRIEIMTPLFPKLTEGMAANFDEEAREALYGCLNYSRADIVHNTLFAIEKVGTGDGIKHIERFIKSRRFPSLRIHAQKVLEILILRDKKEQEAKTLLRGATQPTANPDELLRPAGYSNADPPETLLRASQGAVGE